jgi:hypothetical protein
LLVLACPSFIGAVGCGLFDAKLTQLPIGTHGLHFLCACSGFKVGTYDGPITRPIAPARAILSSDGWPSGLWLWVANSPAPDKGSAGSNPAPSAGEQLIGEGSGLQNRRIVAGSNPASPALPKGVVLKHYTFHLVITTRDLNIPSISTPRRQLRAWKGMISFASGFSSTSGTPYSGT